MVVTNDMHLPSEAELAVEEVPLGTPYLKAGGFYLGKACESHNNEFMLCRTENADPRKCIDEGKAVTSCTMDFFRRVKGACAAEFTQYAMCLEKSSGEMELRYCRKTQKILDSCMEEKLGIERPHFGYYSLPKVHDTQRPKIQEKPSYMDDPRGSGRPVDSLPPDFPRTDAPSFGTYGRE